MKQRTEATTTEEFITAKVRGMRSKLFEGNRLVALADNKSLPELFRRVRPSATFGDHRAFERDLLTDHIRELDRIARYLTGRVFDLSQWLLAHYQLENLKVALRAYFAKRAVPETEALMAPVPAHLALPLSGLLEAPDLRRFARLVPVAEFREALLESLEAEKAPDPVALETTLDKVYSDKLLQLSGGMDEWTRRLVAFDVDFRSLFLILRSKFNYRTPPSEFQQFIVASGTYLTAKHAERLCAANDLPQAINAIPKALLSREKRRATWSLQQLDEALLREQYRLAARCFTESIVSVTAVVAYYYIKRVEFANLVRLTECVRHSFPRADLEGKLLLPTG